MSNHPKYLEFREHARHGRHDEALTVIDALIAEHPDQAALHWQRAGLLERMQRPVEAFAAIERTLRLKPDHVPSLLRYVEMAAEAGREIDPVPPLRKAVAIDPANARAHWLLSRAIEGVGEGRAAESRRLLERAIELDPTLHEARGDRANLLRAEAMHGYASTESDSVGDPDLLVSSMGLRYSRSTLEAALADYEAAIAGSSETIYRVRRADVLHQLQRYDEALAAFDEVLATMSADDPRRGLYLEMRGRSENNGAGERAQIADLITPKADPHSAADLDLNESLAQHAMAAVAQGIRQGRSTQDVIESLFGSEDDPDAFLATSLAQQILNVANEPAPELEAVDPARYPAYQRRFIERTSKALTAVQYTALPHAEAMGVFANLGQHILMRFFVDPQRIHRVAAFAMKPKWPGYLTWLVLRVTGKWKTATMVEWNTCFDDGTVIATVNESPNVFQNGGKMLAQSVPIALSLPERARLHARRVDDYLASHRQVRAIPAETLHDIEAGWLQSQAAKHEYRASIGWVSDAELRTLLGNRYDALAAKVRARIAVLTGG